MAPVAALSNRAHGNIEGQVVRVLSANAYRPFDGTDASIVAVGSDSTRHLNAAVCRNDCPRQ